MINVNNFISTINQTDFALAIFCSLSFISLCFPYGIPLSLPLLLAYSILFLITKKLAIPNKKELILLFLCIIFYLFGVMRSEIIYNVVKRDIVNIVVLTLFTLIIAKANIFTMKNFWRLFHRKNAFFIPIISLISLYKYHLLLNGVKLDFVINKYGEYPWGTSLVTDYNMFCLAMYTGLISIAYNFLGSKSFISKLLYSLSAFPILISIIFAGSRRGWVILIISFIYLIYESLIFIRGVTVNLLIKHKIKQSYFSILFFVSLFLIILIYLVIPEITKIITDNNSYELTKLLFRLSTITGENQSLLDSFSDSRTDYWEYAYELIMEYDITGLFFGEGFDYLSLYSSYLGEEVYPHNPIISAFHYSGVIGSILLMITLILPLFMILSKHKKQNELNTLMLSFMYMLTFVFMFTSGNSIFSVKPLSILIIIIFSYPNQKYKI